jgi:hypothetical protein
MVELFRTPRPSGMRALLLLSTVERGRAGALWGLARLAGADIVDADVIRQSLVLPDIERRAWRIGLLARGRLNDDPMGKYNAHTRSARLLWGLAPSHEMSDATAEAAQSSLGMAASEPGWVRLLDGSLMAAALQSNGRSDAADIWRASLERWFRLRNGHRPSARQELLGVSPATASPWEHASAASIAVACGWIDPEPEWAALRQRVLAGVGRGGRSSGDNRLVAAGRCWAVQVGDEEASSLLQRVSIAENDPIAMALDALAGALARNPEALRTKYTPALATSAQSTD